MRANSAKEEPDDTGNHVEPNFLPSSSANENTFRLYPYRWFILLLFCSYSFMNAYQWIHLNIVSHKVIAYWNKSIPDIGLSQQIWVDYLSLIYMFNYIPLVFPANWILESYGLRMSGIIATSLNAAGAWLKCWGVTGYGERYPLVMVGQAFCGSANVFILGIPAYLAALWFGPKEVAKATALGVFGNQMGVAVGFLIPPMLFDSGSNVTVNLNTSASDISPATQELYYQFSWMMYPVAAICTVLFILTLLFFKSHPPTPPSRGQMALDSTAKNSNCGATMKRLLCHNQAFLLLTISYGINTGVYYSIGTLLNPLLMGRFPDEESGIGWAGFVLVISGLFGAILSGMWLDKTKAFKMTTLLLYVSTLLSTIVFVVVLLFGYFWMVYIIMFIMGFFMTGYLPVGFEFASEITYPENPGVACGILNVSAQIFGIIMTVVMSILNDSSGTLAATGSAIAVLCVGTMLTAFIKSELRRQAANRCPSRHSIVPINEVNGLSGDAENPVETLHPLKGYGNSIVNKAL